MDYLGLIEKRRSIREYRNRALSEEQKSEIQRFFDGAEQLVTGTDAQPELLICENDARRRLEGVVGYRGNAFDAPAYLVLLSNSADHYLENAGFMGEALCLKLTEMGIDHCWLTADDPAMVKKVLMLETEKEVAAVFSCGMGKKERKLRRLDIFTPSSVRVKEREGHVAPKISQDEMVYGDKWGKEMDWDPDAIAPALDQAFYAASLAPSFLNRQPYRFVYRPNMVFLCVKKEEMTSERDLKLDTGAVMLNFHVLYKDVNPVDDHWYFGLPEGADGVEQPEEFEVVGYYPL